MFGCSGTHSHIIRPCCLSLLISSQSVWRLDERVQAAHLPACCSHRLLTSRYGSVCESSSLRKQSPPAFVAVWLHKETPVHLPNSYISQKNNRAPSPRSEGKYVYISMGGEK